MSLIAVAVIGAGLGIGSAVVSNMGQQDAIKAQENALNSLQGYNIPGLEDLASNQDIAKYQQQFDEQAKVDPNYAALRNEGALGMLAQIRSDASGTSTADSALKDLSGNISSANSAKQPVIDQLLSQAANELSLGATLPPEFQSELVKAGLENSGGSGLSLDGRGAGGTNIRTLLGSEGLALQQQRQNQAAGMATEAGNLQTQQQNALDELAQLSNQLTQSKYARAGGAVSVGNATVPNIGLSGADAANLSIANTNLHNNKTLKIGDLQAQSAADNAGMWSNILGSVGGAANSIGGNSYITSLLGSGSGSANLAGIGTVSGSRGSTYSAPYWQTSVQGNPYF